MHATPLPRVAIERVAIVIPARNEARTIAHSLESLRRAVTRTDPGTACWVAVVDDGSTDSTATIAQRALDDLPGGGRVIRVDVGCVGAARRIGVEAVTAHWRRPDQAWVLSTDADSAVRPDWILRHLRHAGSGALAVSGIVDIVDGDEHDHEALRARWLADYRGPIDEDHRHPYAHATNLGVRLDAYRAAGGFRDQTGQEDTDLWRRLRGQGMEPLADARIVVDTSGRRRSRVPRGFAHALATLYPEAGGQPEAREPALRP